MATIFSNSVAEVALKTLQLNGRGFLPQLRPEAAAVLIIQTRGSKKKFGGITRDPFKTFQQKLHKQQQYKHAKAPLVSDERAQMKMDFPLNIQSLGRYCLLTRPSKNRKGGSGKRGRVEVYTVKF